MTYEVLNLENVLSSDSVTKLNEGANVAYILNDNNAFSLTDYKVLKNQSDYFIDCAKLLYNGKIKILYFTSGRKNLQNMLSVIDTDTLITIVLNLIKAIIDIKNNGFLSCCNIDLSFDKIFIDQHTLTAKLIYLPIQNNAVDDMEVENELKADLIKHISAMPSFSGNKMNRVCAALSNGSLSLNELYNSLSAEVSGGYSKRVEGFSDNQPVLEFVSENNEYPLVLKINKPEYVIGKLASRVDGIIDFNAAIGRVHCKFVYQNGQYYIVDGDGTKCSTNGTYVNGAKLSNTQPCPVSNGDRIRLANSDFIIKI